MEEFSSLRLRSILSRDEIRKLIDRKNYEDAYSLLPMTDRLFLARALAMIGEDPVYQDPKIAFTGGGQTKLSPEDQKTILNTINFLEGVNESNSGETSYYYGEAPGVKGEFYLEEDEMADIAKFFGFSCYLLNGYYDYTGGSQAVLVLRPGNTLLDFFNSYLDGAVLYYDDNNKEQYDDYNNWIKNDVSGKI